MPVVVNLDPKVYEGQWKEFIPGLEALIVPYTRKLIRRIMVAATVAQPGTGATRIDPDLWDIHLYRGIIKDIRGPVTPDGETIVCNEAVIDAVCDQIDGFAAWAMQESQAAATAMSRRMETETKNSKRSHGGRQRAPKG